eukprot:EG_transcript_15649
MKKIVDRLARHGSATLEKELHGSKQELERAKQDLEKAVERVTRVQRKLARAAAEGDEKAADKYRRKKQEASEKMVVLTARVTALMEKTKTIQEVAHTPTVLSSQYATEPASATSSISDSRTSGLERDVVLSSPGGLRDSLPQSPHGHSPVDPLAPISPILPGSPFSAGLPLGLPHPPSLTGHPSSSQLHLVAENETALAQIHQLEDELEGHAVVLRAKQLAEGVLRDELQRVQDRIDSLEKDLPVQRRHLLALQGTSEWETPKPAEAAGCPVDPDCSDEELDTSLLRSHSSSTLDFSIAGAGGGSARGSRHGRLREGLRSWQQRDWEHRGTQTESPEIGDLIAETKTTQQRLVEEREGAASGLQAELEALREETGRLTE